MSPGPWVGLALAVALRRWPDWALALAAVAGWGAHVAWGGQWTHRGAVVGIALLLALSPWSATVAGRVVAALLVAAATWVADPLTSLLGGAVVLAGALLPPAVFARSPEPGRWLVAGIAGLAASVLMAFTGSVRLAEECALISVPMLGLSGRSLPPAAAGTVGLLLGTAVAMGVTRSDLGPWALVPAVVLSAAFLGDRGRLRTGLAAVGLAAAGTAPVLIDWFRDPPF